MPRPTVLVTLLLSLPTIASAQTLDKPMNGPEVNGTVVGKRAYLEGFYWPDSATMPIPQNTIITGAIALTPPKTRFGKPKTSKIDLKVDEQRTITDWQSPNTSSPICGDCKINQSAPLYRILYRTKSKEAWRPLCPGGQEGILARWDVRDQYSHVLASNPPQWAVACPGSALFNCQLEWGYQQDESILDQMVRDGRLRETLAAAVVAAVPHGPPPSPTPDQIKKFVTHPLDACVHAIRAEYCVSPESFTVPGVQLLAVRGSKLLRLSASGSAIPQPWEIEAVWHADGQSVCINKDKIRVPFYGDSSEKLVDHLAKMQAANNGKCRRPPIVVIDSTNNCKPADPGDIVSPPDLTTYHPSEPLGICPAPNSACKPPPTPTTSSP